MIVTRAPLRIPLGGGGTDFPNYYLKYGGFICGLALNRHVHVVLHDTIDGKIRLKYSKVEMVDDPDQLQNRVAAEALKWYGITKGIEVATFSDVPEASGLGGSSSFCVALVVALRQKLGLKMDKDEIFASAYAIERLKAGQAGGIQDQFFATYGGAWALDLSQEVIQIPVYTDGVTSHLKLLYTGTTRKDLGIAQNQTKKVTAMDQAMISNLDKTKEMGKKIFDLLDAGDYKAFGQIMNEHWENKKARDPDVTNPTVDALYSKALEEGAIGGKLMGLGGGGYLLLCTNTFLSGTSYIPVDIDREGAKVCYED